MDEVARDKMKALEPYLNPAGNLKKFLVGFEVDGYVEVEIYAIDAVDAMHILMDPDTIGEWTHPCFMDNLQTKHECPFVVEVKE